ncbi:MAG TPA: hypothetical protein VFA32_08720, partial [Dehalococcoidia bacterium]|nr:hypothetical protein [Dehalococcoidia bacterium]
YAEFFEQCQRHLPEADAWLPSNVVLTYESSRGCWWGQKHHCTFCGLNGETMSYRQKSAQRLLSDVKTLVSASPTKRVCMTDNILPHNYFRSFLPRAPEEIPGVTFFYEVKANLSLQDVMTLKQAGVKMAQPGIESLSNACLQLMKKGVSAQQNISCCATPGPWACGWAGTFSTPCPATNWWSIKRP